MDRKEIIRKIANVLNDMGHPCCRCMHCKTCRVAETIYNFIKMQTFEEEGH